MMPKLEAPPPHLVLFDTSTLFHQDKSYVVDPKVDAFLEEYRQRFSLSIQVPEVVMGELLYQQTTQALSHLGKANAAIETVSGITDKSYSHRVTDARVKREVEQRFRRWVDRWGATIVNAPVDSIDWDAVIECAVWRLPPFTSDDGKEKGFRDCMILESIVSCAKHHDGNDPLALVCKDNALRRSVADRLSADSRFSCYERIADFQSYLDLTLEDLEDRFIKAILKRAQAKFFTSGDQNCLAYRADVASKLRERYAAHFRNPEQGENRKGALAGLLSEATGAEWTSVHFGKFWVGAPEFVEKTEESIYYWKTEIEYTEPYKRADETKGLLSAILDPERVRILRFAIKWRSKVTADGRFLKVEYVDDSLIENEFRSPTSEEKAMWQLSYEN